MKSDIALILDDNHDYDGYGDDDGGVDDDDDDHDCGQGRDASEERICTKANIYNIFFFNFFNFSRMFEKNITFS